LRLSFIFIISDVGLLVIIHPFTCSCKLVCAFRRRQQRTN